MRRESSMRVVISTVEAWRRVERKAYVINYVRVVRRVDLAGFAISAQHALEAGRAVARVG